MAAETKERVSLSSKHGLQNGSLSVDQISIISGTFKSALNSSIIPLFCLRYRF